MSRALALLVTVAVVAACGRSPSPPAEASAPVGAVLFTGSFADVQALDAWKKVDGAIDGEGPASAIALDDGGVRLEGSSATRHWQALERTVALSAVTWVRVSARTRTEGLVPDGTHRALCYVYTRFNDAEGKRLGELLATRNMLGTTAWTPVARRFPVPAGATSATVGVFLSLPGRAWFDGITLEAVPAPDWHEVTSGHYRYHWLGTDAIPDAARAYDDESFRVVTEFLELDAAHVPAMVDLFKYPDRSLKEELTGDAGNAFTSPDGTMHSIFATDRHEIVHVLARPWGHPPALLGEGLAVYLSGAWQGKPVAAFAKGLVDTGWIPLADLLDTEAFRAKPDLSTYPIAGALVEWMLAQPGGKARLRALYGRLEATARVADNRRAFEAVVGATIEQVDAKLRDWLHS